MWPRHSRALEYAQGGSLAGCTPASQSTVLHSGSFAKFSRGRPPARIGYLATGLDQYGEFTTLRTLLFL